MSHAGVIGIFLMVLAVILFVYSLPTLSASVQTGNGTALQNESEPVKNIYRLYDLFLPALGIIIFIVGFGMLVKL